MSSLYTAGQIEANIRRRELGEASQALQRGAVVPHVRTVLGVITEALDKLNGTENPFKHDDIVLVPFALHHQLVALCPICRKRPSMYEITNGRGKILRAVNCSSGDPWGGLENGCPMYNPGREFDQPTYSLAAQKWNECAYAADRARGVGTTANLPTDDKP